MPQSQVTTGCIILLGFKTPVLVINQLMRQGFVVYQNVIVQSMAFADTCVYQINRFFPSLYNTPSFMQSPKLIHHTEVIRFNFSLLGMSVVRISWFGVVWSGLLDNNSVQVQILKIQGSLTSLLSHLSHTTALNTHLLQLVSQKNKNS